MKEITFPTRVVNCRKEPYEVYIGRGSKWGNPFKISKGGYTREAVIHMYEEYLIGCPELLADLPELKGKVLGCYCKPQLCHGDILARLANQL